MHKGGLVVSLGACFGYRSLWRHRWTCSVLDLSDYVHALGQVAVLALLIMS